MRALDWQKIRQAGERKSWERIDVHKRLLKDKVRNAAYKAAISKYCAPGMTSLDIGAGTGLLTFFAVQAGCDRVYSVESTDIIRHARKTAKLNGFEDRIRFIQKDVFDLKLPDRKVDILIHDQIGGFLWNEGMIGKVRHSRKKFLKPGGLILPARFELFLVPASLPDVAMDTAFWRQKSYGISFACIGEAEARHSAELRRPRQLRLVGTRSFLSAPLLACTTDLYDDFPIPDEVSMSFTVTKDQGPCTAIVGSFRIIFDDKLSIDTSPARENTNWEQFILPLANQQRVRPGSEIHLRFRPAADPRMWRWKVSYR